jgi:hypothetical protein
LAAGLITGAALYVQNEVSVVTADHKVRELAIA